MNSFFLGEIIWWPLFIFIYLFIFTLFFFKDFTSKIFQSGLHASNINNVRLNQKNFGFVVDYFDILFFFCRYFILIYVLLFLNNSYFFSYTNIRYFYSFNLNNNVWLFSCIIYLFAIVTFLLISGLIYYNVVKSIEFFLGINFFFLTIQYFLMINNFVVVIFVFEIQSLIFMFMLSSLYSSNIYLDEFFLKTKLVSAQPIWYFNALIYQFWVSFIGTLLLIYSALSFFKFTSFMDWNNLNIFLYFLEFSWLNEFNFQMYFILFIFIMSLFLKLGFFPFFLWKPEIYKNLNILTLFLYMTTYLFSIIFFTVVLIYQYFSLIHVYFYIYFYVIFIIILILFPLFLYSIVEIRPFLGYSSSIHVIFILISAFYSVDLSFFYLFTYVTYMFFFFYIISSALNINFWYFTDFQFILKFPVLNTALIVFFVGLSGLPPFLGFFAKMSVVSMFLINGDYLLFFLSLISGLFVAFFYIQNYRFFGYNLKTINYNNNKVILKKNKIFYLFLYFIIYINIFSIFYVGDFFIFVQLFKL